MTHPNKFIVAMRHDRFGARLWPMINAARAAKKLGYEFRFVWPKTGPIWTPTGGQMPDNLELVGEIFAPHFIAEHMIDRTAVDGMSLRAQAILGEDFRNDKLIDAAAADDGYIVDDPNELLLLAGESEAKARSECAAIFADFALSPDMAAQVARFRGRIDGERTVAIHLRRGDLLSGRVDAAPIRFAPTCLFQYFVETMLPDSVDKVYVFSDDPTMAGRFKERFTHAADPADLVDTSAANLTAIQAIFLDMMAMSLCGRIIAPLVSSFSATAALIGDRRVERINDLVDKPTQIDILEQSKAGTYAPIRGDHEEFYDYLHLVRLYDERGQTAQAESEIEQLLARFPRNPNGVIEFLEIKNKRGKHQQVLKVGQAALAAGITNHGIYRQVGEAALATGDNELALTCARHGLELRPMYPTYYAAVGRAATRCGAYDEAIATLTDALDRQHRSPEMYRLLVEAHFARGDLKAAGIAACDAVAHFSPQGHQDLFLHQLRTGDLGRGDLLAVMRAVGAGDGRTEPAVNVAAYAYLCGDIAQSAGQPQAAIGSFTVATGLAPGNVGYRLRLANGLMQVGRIEEAERHYRAAIDGDASALNAHHGLCIALQRRQRFDEALSVIDVAVAAAPDNVSYATQRANILYDMGRFEDAANGYRAALGIDALFMQAHNGLAAALQRLGRLDEALAAVDDAVAQLPDDVTIRTRAANLLMQLGRLPEAEDAFRAALTRNPNYAHAHNGLSFALHRLGRREEALAAVGEAIRIEPAEARFHAQQAQLLTDLGRFDDSVTAYERALALDPSLDFAYRGLSRAQYRAGRIDRALAAIRKAIEADPQNETYRADLDALLARQTNEGTRSATAGE